MTASAATRLLCRLALVLAVVAPLGARAAPGHAWRTMESPHFELHFHEGLYPVALRAARSLERAHERLVPLLGAAPSRKTQVVLSDDTDSANGSATAHGRPQIFLLAEPPDDLSALGDYDDYVYMLVAHEYVHVLHLGTVNGVPRWLNRVVGDTWIPNGAQPRFATEGLAVYQESHLSAAGRLRASLLDMYLRADVLEDRLLTLGELANGPDRWPWGTAWYLYGGKLMQYLAETRGDEALLRYSHEYGSSVIPWAMNMDLAAAAGVDFITLYDEWAAAMGARYAAQLARVRASGPITAPAVRTRHGERTGAPRFARDGTLYYVEATPHRRPWLRALDVRTGEDREVQDLAAAGELAPLPDGRVLLAAPAVHRAHRVVGELFLLDGEREVRLTHGARASELDVSPDGRRAVYVRRGEGRTSLVRIALADPGRVELLYEPPEGQQLFTPRFAPDGERVVFSRSRAGTGRDLFVLEGGELRRLTDDTAVDVDPTFTPDGETVIFSSDRTGIFDLYAVPAAGGAPVRLTNEITGAFQPTVSPDGAWLAWTTYSSRGFDVAAIELARLERRPAAAYVDDRPAPQAPRDGALYPVRPYRPLETLAPQTWFPLLGADAGGTVLGATLGGADLAGLHAWTLAAGWGVDSKEPQAGASWTWYGMYPTLTAGAGTSYRGVSGFPAGTTERASGGSLALTFPWGSMRRSHAFTVGYEANWLEPITVDPADAPERGLAAELQTFFRFSSAERPAESISLEDGVSGAVGLRFGLPALGSDFEYTALDLSGGAYLRLPWLRHHVLALLGRFGIGSGDLGRRRLYGLGGPLLRDPILDLVYTGQLMGSSYLRGYAPGSFGGSRVLLATAEYRLPLLDLDEGPWTLPLHVGDLSLAVFGEAGDAWDGPGSRGLHPAAGAELRLDLRVGNLGGSVRLGDAYGFDVDDGGGNHVYLGVGGAY